MFELVSKLTAAFGVCGNEEHVRETILELIRDRVDEVVVDAMGNLIAIKRGRGKKVMLAAHMDEIGVIATYIDDRGFVRFSNVGWVSPYFSLGQRVRFKNGITGAVYYEEKLEDMKNLKLSKLYIDIGADGREDALGKIKPGDVAAFCGEAIAAGGKIMSKALDDRSGCAVLVNVILDPPETDNEIYYVFTTQEELGLRGAKTAAYRIRPDIAIAVDITLTGDIPECQPMELKLGGGPAVKIKDRSYVAHPEVRRLIEDSARELGIELQREILEAGGSDPGAIHLEAGGIPSGGVSIPCRYAHSPVEIIDLGDLKAAVRLLKKCIERFKGLK